MPTRLRVYFLLVVAKLIKRGHQRKIMTNPHILNALQDAHSALEALLANEQALDQLAKAGDVMADAIASGHHFYLAAMVVPCAMQCILQKK